MSDPTDRAVVILLSALTAAVTLLVVAASWALVQRYGPTLLVVPVAYVCLWVCAHRWLRSFL